MRLYYPDLNITQINHQSSEKEPMSNEDEVFMSSSITASLYHSSYDIGKFWLSTIRG